MKHNNYLTAKEAIARLTNNPQASVVNRELGISIRISADAYEIDGVVTARRHWLQPVDSWLDDCFFANRAKWHVDGTL